MATATITLDKERRRGKNRPVIHILTTDGKEATFRDRGIVLFEDGATDGKYGLYAILVTGDGQVCQTQDGKDAIVAVPVAVLGVDGSLNADQLVSGWKAIGEFMGVSASTAKRMARDGRLPEPSKHAGHRHVALTKGQLRQVRNQDKAK